MFFSSIPPSVRPRDYDRTAVVRLIHECMGLPASPPATSEDGEVDSDSPPSRSTSVLQSIPIQIQAQQDQPNINPQLIRIDERTMQLHFTPVYFGKTQKSDLILPNFSRLELLDAMTNTEFNQLIDAGLF